MSLVQNTKKLQADLNDKVSPVDQNYINMGLFAEKDDPTAMKSIATFYPRFDAIFMGGKNYPTTMNDGEKFIIAMELDTIPSVVPLRTELATFSATVFREFLYACVIVNYLFSSKSEKIDTSPLNMTDICKKYGEGTFDADAFDAAVKSRSIDTYTIILLDNDSPFVVAFISSRDATPSSFIQAFTAYVTLNIRPKLDAHRRMIVEPVEAAKKDIYEFLLGAVMDQDILQKNEEEGFNEALFVDIEYYPQYQHIINHLDAKRAAIKQTIDPTHLDDTEFQSIFKQMVETCISEIWSELFQSCGDGFLAEFKAFFTTHGKALASDNLSTSLAEYYSNKAQEQEKQKQRKQKISDSEPLPPCILHIKQFIESRVTALQARFDDPIVTDAFNAGVKELNESKKIGNDDDEVYYEVSDEDRPNLAFARKFAQQNFPIDHGGTTVTFLLIKAKWALEELQARGGGRHRQRNAFAANKKKAGACKWVSTGKTVTISAPRNKGRAAKKTVYRNTSTGEFRVRKMVASRSDGTKRVSYVKF